MADFTLQLNKGFAFITIHLCVSNSGWHELHAQGMEIPEPIQMKALIDTGATATCIEKRHLEALKIQPRGTGSAQTASQCLDKRIRMRRFEADIVLEPTSFSQKHQNLAVYELPQIFDDVDAIIGTDILANYDFHYDGLNGTFTLTVQ